MSGAPRSPRGLEISHNHFLPRCGPAPHSCRGWGDKRHDKQRSKKANHGATVPARRGRIRGRVPRGGVRWRDSRWGQWRQQVHAAIDDAHLFAFPVTLGAGLATLIGASLALFATHTDRKVLALSLGFSTGSCHPRASHATGQRPEARNAGVKMVHLLSVNCRC